MLRDPPLPVSRAQLLWTIGCRLAAIHRHPSTSLPLTLNIPPSIKYCRCCARSRSTRWSTQRRARFVSINGPARITAPAALQVPGACFSRVPLEPLRNPELVCASQPALDLVGVTAEHLAHPDFAKYFSGADMVLFRACDTCQHHSRCPGASPPRTATAGSSSVRRAQRRHSSHAAGVFAGQLGDGAAKYLGEVSRLHRRRVLMTQWQVVRGGRWELQVKGAGETPYSRNGDGRKVRCTAPHAVVTAAQVLRSSIREFLCSEAMHHLGVPTTRAGYVDARRRVIPNSRSCIITSDSKVMRDLFYTGRNILVRWMRHCPRVIRGQEKCSTVLRIAPSFLRSAYSYSFINRLSVDGRQLRLVRDRQCTRRAVRPQRAQVGMLTVMGC